MNLHRTNKKPDWAAIAANERNVWQRTAAATNGVVTPGNLATFIGMGLVVAGLVAIMRHVYLLGMVLIIVGRLFDLLDGWLAETTQTKSPLGELLDAAVDKAGTILTVIAFYVAMLAPWWVLTLLLLPHLVIIVISVIARYKGIRLHPSRVGKLSMAAVWLALFGMVMVRALHLPADGSISAIVYIVAGVSIGMGIYAAVGYVRNRD